MSGRPYTPTAAQKAAALDRRTRMQQFAAKVAKMTPEQRMEMFQAHPIVSIEGKSLSVYNTCFILTQDEQATVVGGFQQWRRVGRVVKKGERGLSMWFPRRQREDLDKQEGEMAAGELEMRFMLGMVFDVMQTEEIESEVTK